MEAATRMSTDDVTEIQIETNGVYDGALLDFGTGSLYVVSIPEGQGYSVPVSSDEGTYNVRMVSGNVTVLVAEYDPRNYVGRV